MANKVRLNSVARFFASVLAMALCRSALGKNIYPTDGECDGLPKVRASTLSGFCLGVVAQGLAFPRGILPLPNGDLLVADMGGWEEKKDRFGNLPGAAEPTSAADR